MRTERIVRVEFGMLEGRRPLPIGSNARRGPHGAKVDVPLCRLTTLDGATGFGLGRPTEELACQLTGLPLSDAFSVESGTADPFMPADHAFWDLAGRRAEVPVYQLVASDPTSEPPTVECYYTNLLFDDLDDAGLDDGGVGAVVERAASALDAGYRCFKVKVGRGGRWMEPEAGLDRDVAVIEGVREAVGDDCGVLADANNGFTLNGTLRFLDRTRSSRVGWIEEPFAEDNVLLAALRDWIAAEGLGVLVADGETATTGEAEGLARQGVLDVVQCDILQVGFSGWLRLGPTLDALGIASAPHHHGRYLGNYVTGHLAPAVKGFRYVEWDEATVPGLAPRGYAFSEGRLRLSTEPGFGVDLDEEAFSRAVKAGGFDIRLTGLH
jgi:L-rhamnonate dehydratase